jgi:hypothetical protein
MKVNAELADLIGDVAPAVTREWFGSERDAVVRRLDLFNKGLLLGKKADHTIDPVDVPTAKADLLVWLNRECV